MKYINTCVLVSSALEIIKLEYFSEFVLVRLVEFSNMFVFIIFLLKCLEYEKIYRRKLI